LQNLLAPRTTDIKLRWACELAMIHDWLVAPGTVTYFLLGVYFQIRHFDFEIY
jgi:hypothetical protein